MRTIGVEVDPDRDIWTLVLSDRAGRLKRIEFHSLADLKAFRERNGL